MPDITVHPHGDRWAVAEADAESPLAEFPTREAAEQAAQQRAAGGSVRVLDRDPTGLGPTAEPGGADRGEGSADRPDGMRERDHVRTEQGGL